ncbi:MAG TPA: serine hydrolase [Luteibacter sp.]|jgi:CubicO group peptidase (beta-lactamase class C family)|nr:serine hydrolase [Luteibacter sp.]
MLRKSVFTLALGFALGFALSATAATSPPPAAGNGWQGADAASQGVNTATLSAVEGKIVDGTYKDISSILVVRHGKLVYEHYFNDGGPEVLNDIRSASKSVTALLVGAAIDRKLIADVHARVYDFFPDRQPVQHPDPRKRAFTLEDLMTMSSLWECDDENQFSTGNEERMYVTESWLQFALDLPIKGFAPWMTKPADSPYGRSFSYCTADAFVAGAAVERAAGRPLSEFAAEVLEKPLGIDKVQWNRSPEGIGMGGGGTRYRSRDLAKFGELALEGGRWQGKQVIPEAFVKAMLTPHAQAREDAEYGYFWWHFHFQVNGRDVTAWAMSGNGGNYVFVVPERQLVAVITSKAYNQRYAHPQSQAIFRDYVLKSLD